MESIRQSISVAALETNSSHQINLEFAFQGLGTDDEKEFVRQFSDQFSKRLYLEANGEIRSNNILMSIAEDKVDRLEWLVSQIENDIQSIRTSVASVGQSPTAFRNASHSSSTSAPTMQDIQNALASIDVKTVHDQIREIGSFRSLALASDSPDGQLADGELFIRPVGGVPTIPALILLVMFSMVLGSIVSMNYQPFSDRGFENVSRLAKALRIPVIAVLPTWAGISETPNEMSEANKKAPWANRAVGMAKLALLGLLILTIGFCLIDGGVREAFGRNPFFGFAKMIWVFIGY